MGSLKQSEMEDKHKCMCTTAAPVQTYPPPTPSHRGNRSPLLHKTVLKTISPQSEGCRGAEGAT